jgi:hypothetical protein
MALRALIKPDPKKGALAKSSVVQLYRSILKEVPRVLTLYDVDMPVSTARTALSYQFRKNGFVKDGRYVDLFLFVSL